MRSAGSTITFTDSATTTGLSINSSGLNAGESITISVATLTSAGGTFVLGGTKDVFTGGGTAAAGAETATPPAPPVAETAQEQLKRDPQLQRALDLLKAMKILDKSRPGPAGSQAQAR